MIFNKIKLKELCTVNQGLQIPISKRFTEDGPNRYFYITVQFLKENGENYYIENPSSSVICNKDDILVVRTGNTGQVLTGVKGCFHNNFFKVTPNEIIIKRYLYWSLNNSKMYKVMLNAASGTTIPDLKHSSFYGLEISVPSKDNQLKIIKILDAIDFKIKINKKINNNLFEILKTYYKEHFIDNENKNMKKMCDLVKETIGGDWGKDKITDNYNQEVLCIRGADIPDMDRGNKGKTPKRFTLEKNVEKKQLCGNEIVIEISGGSPTQSTGRCVYITKMLESSFELPIICTNFCRAIRLKDDKYLPSFYMNLKYLYEKNIMFLYENGTTGIKNLDLSSFLDNEEINIIEEENQKFNNLYYNINNKMIKNAEENRILEQLRDTLLPKLMNGEIDLDNIEI